MKKAEKGRRDWIVWGQRLDGGLHQACTIPITYTRAKNLVAQWNRAAATSRFWLARRVVRAR